MVRAFGLLAVVLVLHATPTATQRGRPVNLGPAGLDETPIVSGVATATMLFRGASRDSMGLALAVIWRGRPGWFMNKTNEPESRSDATGSGDKTRLDYVVGGVKLVVEFDSGTGKGRVLDWPVDASDGNVVLVNHVDDPKQRRIVGRATITPSSRDATRALATLGLSPQVVSFVQCDLLIRDPMLQSMANRTCAQIRPPSTVRPR